MCAFRHTSRRNIISQEIRETLTGAVDLILPFKCAVCGNVSDTKDRFGDYDRLYQELYGKEPELHICGKCLSEFTACEEIRRWLLCLSEPVENDPVPGLPLYTPFAYTGIAEKCIPKIKFGKQIELARFFGCVMGSLLAKDGICADLMVPVPLSSSRLEERGFNQAGEIAYPVARLNGIPYAEDCLIRTRDTKRQSEIDNRFKRASNMKGAFSVSSEWDVTGLTIAVVDDVVTTGSTLHEAAAALKKAGAADVLCIAFAGNRTVKNAEPF